MRYATYKAYTFVLVRRRANQHLPVFVKVNASFVHDRLLDRCFSPARSLARKLSRLLGRELSETERAFMHGNLPSHETDDHVSAESYFFAVLNKWDPEKEKA